MYDCNPFRHRQRHPLAEDRPLDRNRIRGKTANPAVASQSANGPRHHATSSYAPEFVSNATRSPICAGTADGSWYRDTNQPHAMASDR